MIARRTVMKSAAMNAVIGAVLATASGQAAGAQANPRPKQARFGPFIEAGDGTKLFYRDWGDGMPVIFCHPWGLNADIWEYQLTELSERGFRCVAYDRRGHGRSEDPGHGYDYDTLAADLGAVIEQLDLRNVTLVGYSMGGGEVARYVSRSGKDRVSRVVLVSSVEPVTTNRVMFDNFVASLKKDRPAFLAGGLPLFLGKDSAISPAMSQWVLDQFLLSSPKAAVECARANATGDHRPHLGALTIPTMIIQGDKDDINPLELTGQKLAKAISGSQLKIYEGAPHGIVLTHRDRFTHDLLSFMQS